MGTTRPLDENRPVRDAGQHLHGGSLIRHDPGGIAQVGEELIWLLDIEGYGLVPELCRPPRP
jgi:hypothetical protein